MIGEREGTPPPRPDLRSAAARIADAALALLRARGELASVEFAEERERLKRSLLTLAVAILMLAFALGGIGMWIVAYFWDAHRLEAIAAVTIIYALLAFGLWKWDAARSDAAPAPFAATLAELEKDRIWLAQQTQPRPPREP